MLDRVATTLLYNVRVVQNMLITVYKRSHYNLYPEYPDELLTLRSTVYSIGETASTRLSRSSFF